MIGKNIVQNYQVTAVVYLCKSFLGFLPQTEFFKNAEEILNKENADFCETQK
jgi:hypothetical protein